MKYRDWLEIWLKNYAEPTVKRRTYERYLQLARKHIAERIGEKELWEITPLELQQFITELLRNGNLITGRGLSANTVNGIVTVLKGSLKAAYILSEIPEPVADRIKRPKPREKAVTCFSRNEQKKIEQAVLSGKKEKMIGVVLCLYTGLRIGELLALKWSDIDFRKSVIFVNKTCYDSRTSDGCFCRIIDDPKTLSSYRTVPVPTSILRLLETYRKPKQTGCVITAEGEPLSVRSYQRSFELLLKRLHIRHRGFHSLRHTFATRALECGMDIKTLAEILGHKNPTITLTRYTHSMTAHKRQMMNRLGELL